MRVLEGEFREGDLVQVDAGPARPAVRQTGRHVAATLEETDCAARIPHAQPAWRAPLGAPPALRHDVVRPRVPLPARAGADLLPRAGRTPDSLQRVQVARRAGQGRRSHRRRAGHSRHAEARRREREAGAIRDDPHRGSVARRRARKGGREVHRRADEPLAARAAELDHSLAASCRRSGASFSGGWAARKAASWRSRAAARRFTPKTT